MNEVDVWMCNDVAAGGGIVVMGGQKALLGVDVLSGCMYCHAGMYSMTLSFLDSPASHQHEQPAKISCLAPGPPRHINNSPSPLCC